MFEVNTEDYCNLLSIIENTESSSNAWIPGMTDFSIDNCYYSKKTSVFVSKPIFAYM